MGKKSNRRMNDEPFLFSEEDMKGGKIIRKKDDLEQFTDAVVYVLEILEHFDKPGINSIAEECYYNSLEAHGINETIYLHSIPGYFFNIIQYIALEYCVQKVATPFYRWSTFMPEGCYERGLMQYEQQKAKKNIRNRI